MIIVTKTESFDNLTAIGPVARNKSENIKFYKVHTRIFVRKMIDVQGKEEHARTQNQK